MYKILEKRMLGDAIVLMKVSAPHIASKTKPGQFVIIRSDEFSERIPLTIADYDATGGWVTIIFQIIGSSTRKIAALGEGEAILDFVGPLGNPSDHSGARRVAVVAGGLGCAIAYPQAKALHLNGAAVDIIAGFRTKELIILEEELAACSDSLTVLTDDGSNGNKGLVTDGLRQKIEGGANYDLVIAIGPVVMMKFVSRLTAEFGIPTTVSMNPIMVDGTGMCGGCRVTVGGKVKFACIDGPEFDGHEVDFDELMKRNKIYLPQETHSCNLIKAADKLTKDN